MFDSQPVLGAPPEVHQMQQLIQATPVSRAANQIRTAPLEFATIPRSYTQAVRADGTVGAAPQSTGSSSIASPCIYGVTPGCPSPNQRAGIDQRAPLQQDTQSAQQGAQSPSLVSMPAPDQIPPMHDEGMSVANYSPGVDAPIDSQGGPGGSGFIVPPGTSSTQSASTEPSHGFNIGLALGIAALLGLGVAGIAVAVRH